MSPRPYQLRARAVAVSETRRRVVAAARELFVEGGFYRASMEEIARRADVARATIYHQFRSKLGVLEAVVTDFEDRAGLARLVTIVETARPSALVGAVISEGCVYWATDPTLVRKVIGLATMEPEVRELTDRHDAGRLAVLKRVVERLLEAGVLGDGCSPEHAVNVLWVVTSFEAYDLLSRGRGLPQADVADTLVHLAEGQLLLGT